MLFRVEVLTLLHIKALLTLYDNVCVGTQMKKKQNVPTRTKTNLETNENKKNILKQIEIIPKRTKTYQNVPTPTCSRPLILRLSNVFQRFSLKSQNVPKRTKTYLA